MHIAICAENVCLTCQRPFEVENGEKVFCSDQCREEFFDLIIEVPQVEDCDCLS